MANEAELLADLLDGRLGPADVPPELAELAQLADAVSAHITVVPPTEAFREALREQVVESAGGAAAGGTTGAAGATGPGSGATIAATSATGGLPGIIAGITATAVLAAGGISAADRAVPGDLLYDAKRGIESVQLAIADDERDVQLLADFAAERVREAIGLADPAAVNDLLRESQQLLDRALALAAEQGRSLDELLRPYTGALVSLASRTEDPGVAAHVEQLLDDLGVRDVLGRAGVIDLNGGGGDDALLGGQGTEADGDAAEQDDTNGASEGGAGTRTDGSHVGPIDELEDPLEGPLQEPVDELGDTLDELEEPLQEPAGELDESLDQREGRVDQEVEGLGETARDALDEIGDGVQDAVDEAGGAVEGTTGLLGD